MCDTSNLSHLKGAPHDPKSEKSTPGMNPLSLYFSGLTGVGWGWCLRFTEMQNRENQHLPRRRGGTEKPNVGKSKGKDPQPRAALHPTRPKIRSGGGPGCATRASTQRPQTRVSVPHDSRIYAGSFNVGHGETGLPFRGVWGCRNFARSSSN